MTEFQIRDTRPEDMDAIIILNALAFGEPDEGQITRALHEDGDSLLSLIACDGDRLVGHAEFFRIWVDGEDVAAGLGPICVHPDVQKQGIGSALVRCGLEAMERQGRLPVFVLGHPDYYPRFGFDAVAAEAFQSSWSGPAFMVWGAAAAVKQTGQITYPRAFDEPAAPAKP